MLRLNKESKFTFAEKLKDDNFGEGLSYSEQSLINHCKQLLNEVFSANNRERINQDKVLYRKNLNSVFVMINLHGLYQLIEVPFGEDGIDMYVYEESSTYDFELSWESVEEFKEYYGLTELFFEELVSVIYSQICAEVSSLARQKEDSELFKLRTLMLINGVRSFRSLKDKEPELARAWDRLM